MSRRLEEAAIKDIGGLWILTHNCGGIGGKTASLIALLRYMEADVVCLQEVAGLEPADLCGLG